ncbi:MAG TPA: hypothetical protein VFV54_07750 [Thermoanaerobaculia bacterium]|nr:hypothetical protein [Thermoanaerobaculia bacterium]
MRPSSIAVAGLLVLIASTANGAEPLFPEPLHLTREIQDPITERTTVVEEYFFGDRAVSTAGAVTVIVDYSKGETIRIDRGNGTWSVATLDDLARAARGSGARANAGGDAGWTIAAGGTDRRGSRNVSVYRATPSSTAGGPRVEIEIAIDHAVELTRAGAEVIAGAAWPNERSSEANAILRAAEGEGVVARSAAGAATSADRIGLPLDVTMRWRDGDEDLRFVNRVIRVGSERPPPEALAIARGSRRVDDPRVATAALLDALDRPGAPRE